ncbi:MAG: hypothetical protein HY646_11450 [Acidobacteria bacterium]|nr:hypothetical protein [Acidobacteriota bacterium]
MGRFRVGDLVQVSSVLHPDECGQIGTVAEVILDANGEEKLDRYVVRFQERTTCFWSTELKSTNRASADRP